MAGRTPGISASNPDELPQRSVGVVVMVPSNYLGAMAGAIRRICGDEGLRRQMSDQARRLAMGEFDRDRLAELYRDVLTQAASAAPPGRAPLSVDRRTGNEG